MAIAVTEFPQVEQVEYDTLRPKIRSGDILLCSGSAVISRLIQQVTESVWSHVAFVIRLDSLERVMVLESVESAGVRTIPLSHYVRRYTPDGKGYPGRLLLARHRRVQELTPQVLNQMSRFSVDRFGSPYDRQEMLRIVARIVQQPLGLDDEMVRRNQEYICSEYAWECYSAIGIEIESDPRGFIAPKDFARCPEVDAVAEIRVEG